MSAESTTSTSLGRPRVLDETKRREICAQVAAGESLPGAARYVGCSVRTIRREQERNEPFDQELREAESAARMEPVKAMRQAMHTHWRAAAWMLERTQPEIYGRNHKSGMGRRELKALSRDLLDIIRQEVVDPFVYDNVEKRVRAVINYAMHHAWDQNRTGEKLDRAMKYFEQRDARRGNPFDRPWYGAGEQRGPVVGNEVHDDQSEESSTSTDEAAEGEETPMIIQNPDYTAAMREGLKGLITLAKGRPGSEEEKEALRELERDGYGRDESLSEAEAALEGDHPDCPSSAAVERVESGESDAPLGPAYEKSAAPGGVSTERNSTIGDVEFMAKVHAHLTKQWLSSAEDAEEDSAKPEQNENQPPESSATFGSKMVQSEGATEGREQSPDQCGARIAECEMKEGEPDSRAA